MTTDLPSGQKHIASNELNWDVPLNANIDVVETALTVTIPKKRQRFADQGAAKTASYAMSIWDRASFDTTGGAITQALPSSPAAGDEVQVFLSAGTNTLSLTGTGGPFPLSTAGFGDTLLYTGSAWVKGADRKDKSALDGLYGLATGAPKKAVAYNYATTQERTNLVPTFTKYASNPVYDGAASGPSGTLYWPCVVKAAGVVTSPLDNYYLFYSTDHGAGGIYLATAPTPLGPFTYRQQVYNDTVTGSSCETPTVIYNETTGLWHMYYQMYQGGGIGQQQTLLATSTNLINWTRYGIVIDVKDLVSQPGDGHCGYFMPGKINDMWWGYSLKGGTDTQDHRGFWMSYDGINWQADPRTLGHGYHLMFSVNNYRIAWNHSNIVYWRGRNWFVGLFQGSSVGIVGIAPISADLRQLTGPPRALAGVTLDAWEITNMRAVWPYTEDGRLFVYYQSGNKVGVMTTEA